MLHISDAGLKIGERIYVNTKIGEISAKILKINIRSILCDLGTGNDSEIIRKFHDIAFTPEQLERMKKEEKARKVVLKNKWMVRSTMEKNS